MTILMQEMNNTGNLKMIGLLVKYGANVNSINDSVKTTPLMEACFRGDFIKVKFLISKGANPNLWVEFPGNCPLTQALIQEKINVVHYFLLRKNVNIPPYCFLTTKKREVTVLELLRDLMFPLHSRKHRLKMEVVDFLLKNHGLDYSKEPITEWTLKRIKQLHPSDWEEYIKKY
jgi:ankyrin repeat protein